MNTQNQKNIYIGTSGWSYKWENFYPDDLPSKKRLEYFSEHFPTAEVNYSFYHLPRKTTYEKWFNETSEDFVFAVKLSRFITHVKKLKGIKEPLKKFATRVKELGHKRGPILVQLPPSFKLDNKRLNYFLETAEKVKNEANIPDLRLAFETRHKTWFTHNEERETAMQQLKNHNAAFVFAHSSRYPYPEDEPITADFIYLRFHGPEKLFASKYDKPWLENFAQKIKQWNKNGLDIYTYFNNDVHGYAIENASTLIELTK